MYWCTADIGWVTGHSYIVYGPLANRATQVIYEGTPNTPHEGRHWEIIDKYGVSIYYTAPTLIRTFMKWGADIPGKYQLDSLRVLGSVGEPINPEAWMWYRQHHRARPLPDRGHLVADRDRRHHDLPAARGDRHQTRVGDDPAARDQRHHRQRRRPSRSATGEGGYLVIDKPWPAMLRTIFGDDDRYKDTYWSRFADQGYYFAGDGAKYDTDGALWLLGRVDDVMNISGHRISTTEVESALVSHPAVAEAAVVGAADEMTGQGIVAFVILRGSAVDTDTPGRRTARPTSPRRSARSPNPNGSSSSRNSPKPDPAKSCADCSATSPKTATVGDVTTLQDSAVMNLISSRFTGPQLDEKP